MSYNLAAGNWYGEGPSWGMDRLCGDIEDWDAVTGTCGGTNSGRACGMVSRVDSNEVYSQNCRIWHHHDEHLVRRWLC